METLDIKKIAVIGSGVSGLCVAKHLSSEEYKKNQFEIIVFEKQAVLGGLWNYNKDRPEINESKITPMYKDLVSNFPKQVMNFPDFPYGDEVPSFMHHSVHLKYLNNYAAHFNLEKLIRYKTEVMKVSPLDDEVKTPYIKWIVESKNLENGETDKEVFDAVAVCSGCYNVPRYPTIAGMEHFKGRTLHSKFFDDPNDFKNETLVVCGYRASGADIVSHIYKVCKTVYVSVFKESLVKPKQPENVKFVEGIVQVKQDGSLLLEDGKILHVDTILYCTGYKIDFPFLNEDCGISIGENGHVVSPLYRHIFNIKYPSMGFIGLLKHIPTTLLFDIQCAYLASIFAGNCTMPSQEKMFEDLENDIEIQKSNGKPYKDHHKLGMSCYSLADDMSSDSGQDGLRPVIQKLVLHYLNEFTTNFYSFRKINYKLLDSSSFELISDS